MKQIQRKSAIPGYWEFYQKEEDGYLVTVRRGVHKAEPKEPMDGWESGKLYEVEISVMSDGRVCIYKDHKHFAEPSGYKVFESVFDMEEYFDLKVTEKEISKQEIKKKK